MSIPDLREKNQVNQPIPRKRCSTTTANFMPENASNSGISLPPKLIVRKLDSAGYCQNNCNALALGKSENSNTINNSNTLNSQSDSIQTFSPSELNAHAEDAPSMLLCEENCNKLQKLEDVQIKLEASMYELLNSTKELRKQEIEHGNNPEIDRKRRIEITKILQTLRLQKKNSDKQNELLRTDISLLSKSYKYIQDHLNKISQENATLKAKLMEVRCTDSKNVANIDDAENIKLNQLRNELRNSICENTSLKIRLGQKEQEIKEKNAESETSKLVIKQLHLLNEKRPTSRIKSNDIDISGSKGVKSYDQLVLDFETAQIKHNEFLKQYDVIKNLYIQESEQRKDLTNQLQEIYGNIRVMCRCRPSRDECQFIFNSSNSLSFRNPNAPIIPSLRTEDGQIRFNKVFEPNASQLDIFDEIKPLIISCLDGYNVCLMAFGPTGSGKTYTMQGIRGDPGVTVLAVHELCDLCEKMRGPWDIQTSVSMLEIYNETIYDLLHKDLQAVRLSDDGTDVKVIDAEMKPASSKPEFLYWISKGHAKRKVAATKLNLGSSRSHLIIQVHIDMVSNLDMSRRCSTLVFCDLAGSENVERIEAKGNRAIETGFINKSLSTLARVFESLRSHSTIIPYRDSKLTHFLKPCLCEQAKCVLIVSISGDSTQYEKSMKALEFGYKAMQINLGKIRRNVKILPPKSCTPVCGRRSNLETNFTRGV